jgi:hypothetical protein
MMAFIPVYRWLNTRRHTVCVLAAVMFAHVMLGNAGIPLGDEGVHILQGLRIRSGEISSFNPFYLGYALLLSVVTDDPVLAHLIMRFLVSLGSTSGLYLVLRSIRGLTPLAATLATLAWIGSALCTPHTQLANNSLLCLTLVLPPLALLLRHPSWTAVGLFALASLWTSNIRPEYLAALILVPAGGAWLIRIQAREHGLTPGKPRLTLGTGVLTAALTASAAATMLKPSEAGTSLQTYLLQGLGQCYAVFYRRIHPEEAFNPMTEYQGLLDRVFGNPKTFAEAVANNPGEATRYFIANGTNNLQKLVRELLRGRKGVASTLILVVVLAGTLIGSFRWMRARMTPTLPLPGEPMLSAQAALLLLLACTSLVSIVLLIPDPRYWASWVPLVYLWLAWSFRQITGAIEGTRWELLILAFAVLLFDRSEFPGKTSNQALIEAVRQSAAGLPHTPVIAGNFVVGLSTYALLGRATQINTYNGLNAEDLRNGRYDIFVADGLEGTELWARNREFFDAFVKSPDAFGYRTLAAGMESGSLAFARAR